MMKRRKLDILCVQNIRWNGDNYKSTAEVLRETAEVFDGTSGQRTMRLGDAKSKYSKLFKGRS